MVAPPLHTRSSMTAAASAKIHNCRRHRSYRSCTSFQIFECSTNRKFEKWNVWKNSCIVTTQKLAPKHKAQSGMGSKVVYLLIVLFFLFSLYQTLIKTHGCPPPFTPGQAWLLLPPQRFTTAVDILPYRSCTSFQIFECSTNGKFEKWNVWKNSFIVTTQKLAPKCPYPY